MDKTDPEKLPLYGALTGFTLPVENFSIGPGLLLRRGFVDTFGGWNMGFKPPLTARSPHPGPWAIIRGETSSQHECRVELVVSETELEGFTSPSATGWLVAALLRLRIEAPVRLLVLGNRPFESMEQYWTKTQALAFESASQQWGTFQAAQVPMSLQDLLWLKRSLLVAARLYQNDRFQRAFSIYDEALWASRKEVVTVLIWTAIEILFDASAEQNKTKAICDGVSEWITQDKADRDRAYNIVRDLYMKRGRVVHVGQRIEDADFLQSLMICRAVFGNVLGREKLPIARRQVVH